MAIDPFFGTIIGAGASLLGGAISSSGSAAQNQAQIQTSREAAMFNQQTAREQMAFQERMSSTAYQRANYDMRMSGLNPLLAYSQGGASSPAGASGQMAAAQLENEMEGLGEGVSSAAQKAQAAATAMLAREQNERTKSETELNKASEALAREAALAKKQEVATSGAQQQKLEEEKKLVGEQIRNAGLTAGLIGAQTHSAAGDARLKHRQADDQEKYGDSWLGRNLGSVERMARRVGDAIKRRTDDPTVPKLRDLRPGWFSFEQRN